MKENFISPVFVDTLFVISHYCVRRFNILQKSMRPKLATKTRVVCIVFASTCIFCLLGVILSSQLGYTTLGTALLLAPLILNILLLIVLLFCIRFLKLTQSKAISVSNQDKKAYVPFSYKTNFSQFFQVSNASS